jgi:hypothetical protein
MRTSLALVLISLASFGSLAAADPTPPTDVTRMAAGDCARARKLGKTCVLTIEDEQIEGKSPTAGQPPISVPMFADHSSLIRLRRDFIAEILKTAEDL